MGAGGSHVIAGARHGEGKRWSSSSRLHLEFAGSGRASVSPTGWVEAGGGWWSRESSARPPRVHAGGL